MLLLYPPRERRGRQRERGKGNKSWKQRSRVKITHKWETEPWGVFLKTRTNTYKHMYMFI